MFIFILLELFIIGLETYYITIVALFLLALILLFLTFRVIFSINKDKVSAVVALLIALGVLIFNKIF